MMDPLEIYCEFILHSGCALIEGKHGWGDCPVQHVYKRIAKKHQNTLQAHKVAIGEWIDKTKFTVVPR